MIRPRSLLLALGFAGLPLFAAETESPVRPAPTYIVPGLAEEGARLEKIAGGFLFTEGPARDAKGDVYFTDQPNDRIVRWVAATGKVEDWLKPAGRANGLYFDRAGNLLACADEENQLWSISPEKKVTVLLREVGGRLLNGPNDLWINRDGGIHFTDPLYVRDYWKRPSEMQQEGRHVWYLAPGAKEPVAVATDLKQPNGIVGTPDGRTLYVADIGDGKTYSYRIQPDGRLSDKTLFCSHGSDGMTLDDEGRVFLTGKGVRVFDREGRELGVIEVPEPWTANVTFGGKDRRTLFITASKSVYSLRMITPGAAQAE